MKQLIKDKAPWIVMIFQLTRLCLRERRLFPSHVWLHNGLTEIFANPFEYRGRLMLLNQGKGQSYIKKSWETAINLLTPDVAVDCGANYGEVMCNCTYPENTKLILGIEANPKLRSYLLKTKDTHPNSDKMEIVTGLASDKQSDSVRFFVDKTSSGRSTVMKSNFVKSPEEIKIESYRVDSLVDNYVKKVNSLVFKIDVEGYEENVLLGMTRLLGKEVKKIGCIEFNTKFLRMNGVSLDTYFSFLFEHFEVVAFLDKSNKITKHHLEFFREEYIIKNNDIEIDLLLFGDFPTWELFKNEFGQNSK